VVVDLHVKIRAVNDAFRTLTGLGREELERCSLPDLASALWGLEEPLRSHLEDLRTSTEAPSPFEFEFKTPAKNSRVFSIRGCALKPDGELFLLITIEDITAHKEVERLLSVEQERLTAEVASTARELGRTKDELRALAGSLFTSQEDERRRVARELHDDICQRLAVLEIDAQQIEPRIAADPAQAARELEQVRTGIGNLSEEVRRISHTLHPSVIDDLGIAPGIRSLVNDFSEREHMIVTFDAQQVPDGIPPEIATGLYRITQEALRNVAKHAGRTHVKVFLKGIPDGIRLQIIDSGAGFDVHARRTGLGLISMEERARLIGGSFNIESQAGDGTRLTIDVPLPQVP